MTEQVFVRVDAKSTEEFLARLDTALSPVALSEFLLGQVGPWLQERGRQRFAHEGDDASGKWEPLSAATQQIRMFGAQAGLWQVGPDHPINRRTGELEDYITHGVGTTIPWGAGSSLVFPDPSTARGEVREKMETAQRGRDNPRTPARPVLAMNERDLEVVLNRLLMHITEASHGWVTV